jgi:tetratricopeptide (TPR) repeat protein
VALVGKLAGMSRRVAGQLLRAQGATVVAVATSSTDFVVIGEDTPPDADGTGIPAELSAGARKAVEAGTLQVMTETQLWQSLGLVEHEPDIQRLYTPAMLAELLGVEVAVVRRWHRRGLIRPVREVRRLPYFDFQEVATARRLAELLAAGVSPRTIEKQLASLGRRLPGVDRPLAQLSVIVEGKGILLRQGDGLIEPGGQWRFDFDEHDGVEVDAKPALATTKPGRREPPRRGDALRLDRHGAIALPTEPDQLARLAAELEDDGQLNEAAEMYRAAMAAGGPRAEWCFQVAELLYRLGDPAGARERYYMAIELDEDYVEARANLGCVLAESGQTELAIAAFEGTLKYHADYADVHYHLARVLDEAHREQHAEDHWRAFVELAPDSPWADEARQRLADAPQRLFS